MRILYFASVDFYAKPNPSFHLMNSMLSDLLENGFQIEFIGCALASAKKHIPDELRKNKNFHYQLVKVPDTPKNSFVRRYIDGIRYAMKARPLIKKAADKCDLVFIQSSPTVVYNIFAARMSCKKKKIIYNIQDMFPGSSIASGVMPKKWMQSVFYGIQKIAYKKSDLMVVISEDMKQKLMEQGVPEKKIKVVVNWFDDSQIHEVKWEDNSFAQKYDMDPEKFYVQYAGTMGYVFDYKMVLNVAEILKDNNDIVFQMIGEGSQKEEFVRQAEKRNLSNICFLPLQPQEMVSDVYSACSVCFIPLKKGIIGNSVPSKAGLLMACKRPIITSADEDSDYADMINKNHIGIAVGHNDPSKAAKAVLEMYNDRNMALEMGKKGYEYGHDLYSRSNNMKKYMKIFYDVISK